MNEFFCVFVKNAKTLKANLKWSQKTDLHDNTRKVDLVERDQKLLLYYHQ